MTADAAAERQRCVLVFSGADPSGGAGIAADILAIHAQGAHALPVITALTVQDNDRVFEVLPVEPDVLLRQARALTARVTVDAVKIGITGSAANARAIAQVITELRADDAALPVVLDPVLASGHGDLLSRDDAAQALGVLLPLVTLLTPNGPEAAALAAVHGRQAVLTHPRTAAPPGPHRIPLGVVPAKAGTHGTVEPMKCLRSMDSRLRGNDSVVACNGDGDDACSAAATLLAQGCRNVLVTGGHGGGDTVTNRWFSAAGDEGQSWSRPRLPGEFHGSGCTLAAAAAGLLALGYPMGQALTRALNYSHHALADAYAIAPGQRIPRR
jgi:hydroxymethylpyrimidine/phosphomethylpyrimidine kinase